MKTTIIRFAAFGMIASMASVVLAQSFDMNTHVIAGGGSTSSAGGFSISGTIGQHDAQSQPGMSGGGFTFSGGFWPVTAEACTALGDMNFDGLRDGDDVQRFVTCLTGTGASCSCADVDG